ncbi:MAG: polysaccharide deacetylase family protein, partial [Cyanobacteria bacterium J06648_11]
MKRKGIARAVGVGLSLGGLAIALAFLRPYPLLAVAARLSPDVTFFVESERSAVVLTIDDAPAPATTPQILDLLKQYDARATFFIIGALGRKHPDLLERIVAEGHELGNHTMRDEPSIRLSREELRL